MPLSDFGSWPTAAKVTTIAALTPLAVYAYKCLMMVVAQRYLIYMPYLPMNARQRMDSPVPYRIAIKTDITLRNRRPELHGWHLQCVDSAKRDSSDAAPLLVYFQGNGGNISHRLPVFRAMMDTCPGLDVVAISYRGYGLSSGRPSQAGLIADGVDMIQYALDEAQASGRPVWLYGHSLGGAVAIHALLAHLQKQPERTVQALIVENTFTSISDMLRHLYPRHTPYHHLSPFLRHRWDSLQAMPQLVARMSERAQPMHLAFISGERDEMIPQAMMRRLYTAAMHAQPPNSQVHIRWHSVPLGLHNLTWKQSAYRDALRAIRAIVR
ncbi:hypothetical protein RI367_005422 [Sorochytrium milnesiophthora]